MDSTRRTLDIRAQHNFMLSFLLLIINWCGIVDLERLRNWSINAGCSVTLTSCDPPADCVGVHVPGTLLS